MAAAAPPEEEKSVQEEVSLLILLAQQVIKSPQEAESSKLDCAELARQIDRLSSAAPSLYDRPVRRIAADITKTLDRALSLARKCRHGGLLRHLFSITTTADFRKVSKLLDSSIGDMRWLLSLFDSDETNLSLPPIAASNDPILAWVWSYIPTILMGNLKDRVDAANELASLAKDNDRNKKIIVEEDGILPLLKLLKEGASPEAQIAAANALYNIGTDQERVRMIVDVTGLPIIVRVLGEAQTRVQIPIANLMARMAELDPFARGIFVIENVTRPLISLLSMDLVLPLVLDVAKQLPGKDSINSIVQLNREIARTQRYLNSPAHSSSFSSSDGSSRGGHHKKEKEREAETPELKLKLQVSCAEALWKLSKGSISTSRRITETKGLLCLAKIIEKEIGDLQFNCLMTVMEITMFAECNTELRRADFKTNSPAAKAVFDQLLRVIQEGNNPTLQIASIRSIAAIALGKFACPDNFNSSQHSKAIIDFEGVPALRAVVGANDQARVHGLKLLCYLALSASNSKALEQARALNALEGAARSVVPQNPDLRELFATAINNLTLHRTGAHFHRQSIAP
ncbi:hypothetical protein SLEP1_g13212 [Rubroshorea leprosula]|uniref:DUF7792 domain-containing protein n=1 Tax=Rubroshorea leprosula TaxID=152421 RepID=A0AAV5IQG5_9ROSI|nr:hypothetical protein SLEP1_g13212 [Rubroshorea leprosula]